MNKHEKKEVEDLKLEVFLFLLNKSRDVKYVIKGGYNTNFVVQKISYIVRNMW